ncbi:CoA transferase subunit A [Chelativorans sp. Marseille-P2723]|uniref:CoA transferase subunit A n=1 Tax=Chelativorans sp. Marseille-P2723 TaxID=2709133 RepID=UPI001570D59C|nr:CoA transferase subunit A [Chelativorans sp. Marseille-P2723]
MSKRIDFDEMVGLVEPGHLVGFGGGGIQRKPMAAAAAIARSNLQHIDAASFLGGPEVDLLIGMKKVRRLHFAFVGFDMFGLAPNFRAARQAGELEIVEYSEGLMMSAFEAAAKRLPFLPSRFGLGTDLLSTPTTPFREMKCPLSGEKLVAVPALAPDLAIVHVNEADEQGNALIHSDSYVDLLLIQASKKVVLTAEKIVERISGERRARSTFISRLWVDHVVEAPSGGGFSAVFPQHRFNMSAILEYQKNATDPAWLAAKVGEL